MVRQSDRRTVIETACRRQRQMRKEWCCFGWRKRLFTPDDSPSAVSKNSNKQPLSHFPFLPSAFSGTTVDAQEFSLAFPVPCYDSSRCGFFG